MQRDAVQPLRFTGPKGERECVSEINAGSMLSDGMSVLKNVERDCMEGRWVGSTRQHSSNKNQMWWLIAGYMWCFGRLPFITERTTAASCFTWWKGKRPLNTWIRDWTCIRVVGKCCADNLTSRAVIPKAQMSEATVVWGARSATPLAGASNSHAIQRRVPPMPTVAVSKDTLFSLSPDGGGSSRKTGFVVKSEKSNSLERPKSTIHASPPSLTRTFD